jgi:SAM-dependent methyltransferase
MSWSSVDEAGDPGRMVAGLDRVNGDPFFRGLKARIAELVSDGRVVDVGCGTGADAAATGAVGIELAWSMLQAGRRRGVAALLVQADARVLPIASGAADIVIADRVLQHLHEPSTALAEWRRVLRRGGQLVMCDPVLSRARLDGVPDFDPAPVLGWRAATRPGLDAVESPIRALATAGFERGATEIHKFIATGLDRADGVMGLADWGTLSLGAGDGSDWRRAIEAADAAGTLVYECDYVITTGVA